MTTPLLARDFLFHPSWDGSAHKSTVAQHGRHFEVRWEVRTDALLEHVRRSVHSCEQVTLEAKARENIRSSSKAARKSRRMTPAAEEPALSRRLARRREARSTS